MPIDQAILHSTFDTFFKKLKDVEARADEMANPLEVEAEFSEFKGVFHDLKSEEPALSNYKAAYNLALAMKIAFEKDSPDVFSPAPIKLSSKILSKDISKLDPRLMEIFYPVLDFASENIMSIDIATGKKMYQQMILQGKRSGILILINVMKGKLKSHLSSVINSIPVMPTDEKYQAIEKKSELTSVERFEQKIAAIEQQFADNAVECEFIRAQFLLIKEKHGEEDTTEEVKYLAEQTRALVNTGALIETKNELDVDRTEIDNHINTINEARHILLEERKQENWQSFQIAMSKNVIPIFDEKIAKILDLNELEIENWKRYGMTASENSIYRYMVVKTSDLLGYMAGEESRPRLAQSDLITILRKNDLKVKAELEDLEKQAEKLHVQKNKLSEWSARVDKAAKQADEIHRLADNINKENVERVTQKFISALDNYIHLIKPRTAIGRLWAKVSGKLDLIKTLESAKGGIKEGVVNIDKLVSEVETKVHKKSISRLFESKTAKCIAKNIDKMAGQLITLKK